MGKTRLKLVVTDLVVTRVALWACAAATNKRQRDAIAGLPVDDVCANRLDHSGKFMTRHMREANIRIMPHPAMPVASAQACSPDGDHHAAHGRFGIRQLLDTEWSAECAVDYGLQVEAIQPFSFASR